MVRACGGSTTLSNAKLGEENSAFWFAFLIAKILCSARFEQLLRRQKLCVLAGKQRVEFPL